MQRVLDDTDMLVGHNIKFDLMWLRECGWRYDGPLYDTMVAEYLLSGSRRWPLSLAALAEKYEVRSKKLIWFNRIWMKALRLTRYHTTL